MLTKICLISTLATFFSVDLDICNKKDKITVVGTAIVIKNDAAVRTDDNRLYYLDGIYNWDDEYYEKRVKVTGRLVIVEYLPKGRDPNDSITAYSQHRLGTWRVIKKPKWSLVE